MYRGLSFAPRSVNVFTGPSPGIQKRSTWKIVHHMKRSEKLFGLKASALP